jgi:dihydrofolate reductase
MDVSHDNRNRNSLGGADMGKVAVGLSVSLDGFVAGADDGLERPLGVGGEHLFSWMSAGPESNRINAYFAPPDASVAVIEGWYAECGAIVSGRRTFDIARGWASGHPLDVPIFVVTHHPPTEGEWSSRVTFVTEGVEHAVKLAQEAAGDKAVSVCAANTAQQLLRSGLLDEIEVSVTPVLLGSGVRLFDHLGAKPIELEQVRAIESVGVTHLRYRVVR